jgi:hypothetical protein
VLRAWLLGLMLTFGFAVGGLALLMVQYCSAASGACCCAGLWKR